jgi:hypothetical protein
VARTGGVERRALITVMISEAMAKNPKPRSSAPTGARRRGRPPKPGGRTPEVEVQRAYRARLAAAGKVVRIVDAAAVDPASARVSLASASDFDPATQMICDRAAFADMRDRLHNALLKLELRELAGVATWEREIMLERQRALQGTRRQMPLSLHSRKHWSLPFLVGYVASSGVGPPSRCGGAVTLNSGSMRGRRAVINRPAPWRLLSGRPQTGHAGEAWEVGNGRGRPVRLSGTKR